ncbi:MAG: SPOR domain-containing protein [Betaproteobacteria bacterium]|nr:SPOR domain-containing protein [Betaproteobacteria bacterium]
MSRDYKKSERAAPKKQGHPLFAGIMIGLVVGLIVAVGIALYINFSPKPFVSRDKLPDIPAKTTEKIPADTQKNPSNTPVAADSAENKSGKTGGKPRFDFYTILPGSEEPASTHEAKKTVKPESPEKSNVFLQVGSFQAATEADNMKARLALLGMEAEIQTVSVPDKGVWHRVRVGPFAGDKDVVRARTLLEQNKIPVSQVKAIEDSPR